jgi:hypothetical protein
VFPVTFPQQRLLLLNQLDPSSTSYTVPWSIRITGPLNAMALERSLNEIVLRHEILWQRYVDSGVPSRSRHFALTPA